MPLFDQFAGAESADPSVRMGRPEVSVRVAPRSIYELILRLKEYEEERSYYPWADRFVMGYPLPSWQRPPRWTREQQVRFISSIWMGVDIGSYLVNGDELVKRGDGSHVLREFSNILLDGQQRFTAIQAYLFNEFPVPDVQGAPRYWRDLPVIERRRFTQSTFPRAEVCSWDEAELRKLYDLRNFSGTPHLESERASIPMSNHEEAGPTL